MEITTHLADDNDPTKTACGIEMPVVNRASKPNTAVLCQDCCTRFLPRWEDDEPTSKE